MTTFTSPLSVQELASSVPTLLSKLGKRFSDKPVLRSLLENGEVSVNKLDKIASIATTENDSELAMIVKTLPKNAIETLARDERKFSKRNGLAQPLFETIVPGHELQLNEELMARLLAMKAMPPHP